MSVPSSTDFFPKDVSTGLLSQQFGLEEDEGHVIQRVDSGETNESPFGSNLATPVDGDAFFHKGIHERLDIAEKKGDYFGIDDVQLGMAKSEPMLELDIKPLDEFKVEMALSHPESVSF
jgi:hypothetical protein